VLYLHRDKRIEGVNRRELDISLETTGGMANVVDGIGNLAR